MPANPIVNPAGRNNTVLQYVCSDVPNATWVPMAGSATGALVTSGAGTSGSNRVEGVTDNGVTDTGYPVSVGGVANTVVPTSAVTGQRKALWMGNYGHPIVGAYSQASADGRANVDTSFMLNGPGSPGSLATRAEVFNGTTWDRARGDVSSTFSKAPPLAKTDRSITASTTTQQAAAANATRSRFFIKNTDAAISVYVNLGAAATTGAGSIEIAAKGILELSGTNQALNVIAASSTPVVTIWEF